LNLCLFLYFGRKDNLCAFFTYFPQFPTKFTKNKIIPHTARNKIYFTATNKDESRDFSLLFIEFFVFLFTVAGKTASEVVLPFQCCKLINEHLSSLLVKFE